MASLKLFMNLTFHPIDGALQKTIMTMPVSFIALLLLLPWTHVAMPVHAQQEGNGSRIHHREHARHFNYFE